MVGPWKVYPRWVQDSDKFNEWMNPIDYETEEFQQEQEALAQESPRGVCPQMCPTPQPYVDSICSMLRHAWCASGLQSQLRARSSLETV